MIDSMSRIRKLLLAASDEATASIKRYVVPLFADNEHTWEPSGTGVLVKLGSSHFLATSKHGIECIRDSGDELILAIDRSEIRLESFHYLHANASDVELDIALVPLSTTQALKIGDRRSYIDLNLPTINLHETSRFVPKVHFDFILGFPYAMCVKDADNKTVTPVPIAITCSSRSSRVDRVRLTC